MVCIPCFIIPVLLYVWHKFLQPILLKYWNPWEKKEAIPEFAMDCTGGQCKLISKQRIANGSDKEPQQEKQPAATSDEDSRLKKDT